MYFESKEAYAQFDKARRQRLADKEAARIVREPETECPMCGTPYESEDVFQPGDISDKALNRLVQTDCTDCGLRAGFSPHADQCVSEAAKKLGQGAFR